MAHDENHNDYYDPDAFRIDETDTWKRYDWVKIGNRIREERQKMDMSQRDLINRMRNRDAGIGKAVLINLERGTYDKNERFTINVLSDLENGVPVKGLAIRQLTALCDIFQCDIGYLLCEYDEKTWGKRDIAAYTGLSEEAVDVLHGLYSIGKNHFTHALPFINQILSDYETVLKMSSPMDTIIARIDMAKGKITDYDKTYIDGAVFHLACIIAEEVEKLAEKHIRAEETKES